MVDNADLLGQVSLFDGLTRDDLVALGSHMRETHFAAGDVVVREGTRGARVLACFVILDGTVTVSVEGEPRSTLSVGATSARSGSFSTLLERRLWSRTPICTAVR